MLDPRFVIFGALLNLFGSGAYIRDTLRGQTRPNRVSWLLWSIAPMIAFGGEIGEHVGIQALTTFMAGFCPLLVLTTSFVNRKAYWQLTRFDIGCGILSLCAVVLWAITRTGNIAIIFSVLADGLAATPTIIKSYRHPDTESSIAFLASGTSGVITLLTIHSWTFALAAFPIYLVLCNAVIFTLTKFPRFRLNRSFQ
ncbi:MAG TPA: hypothetical protein VMS08_05570 [Candidatus Saccharimonadia bacterium]|nr:hypothetical protein [Candidatus Saccharimonadia bacterium]